MGKVGKKHNQPNYTIPLDTLKSLTSLSGWIREELVISEYSELGKYLDSGETITVLISGSMNPEAAHSYGEYDDIIAGFDWFRHETKPKPEETEINIYHHVIRKPDKNGMCNVYRVRDDGPFDHWFQEHQIDTIKIGHESAEQN